MWWSRCSIPCGSLSNTAERCKLNPLLLLFKSKRRRICPKSFA
jgi:hypothetical protein